MKRKVLFLFGLIICGLIGWIIGYIRVPMLGEKYSFLMGFTLSLALVLFVFILLVIWNKHQILTSFFKHKFKVENAAEQGFKTYRSTIYLSATVILFGCLITGYWVWKQNLLLKKQISKQNEQISEQMILIESIRKADQVHLISNVLNRVDKDLLENENGVLSNSTIGRIASLSFSLKPYRYLKKDSLSQEELSPERGQLLLALYKMGIDSISFKKVILNSFFSSADLEGANLRKINLRNSDLRNVNLREAGLRMADLDSVNLRDAVLWGANLQNAELRYANLQGADFSWSNLNEASLRYANLNDIKMKSARLKNADISHVSVRAGNLDGALLTGANLFKTDLAASSIKKANFSEANLRESKLKYCDLSQTDFTNADLRNSNLLSVNLSEAILKKAKLDGVLVDGKDWFEKLKDWKVIGLEDIKAQYQIVEDQNQASVFKIKKKQVD